MTVAAVVLAASPESALADTDGVPGIRRIVDGAWAGGAVPIVVVCPDPQGTIGRVLAGTPVTLAEPAPLEGGPVAQIARGIELAAATIRETDAALVWPARCAWVGPETVTSLIEAHGTLPGSILRPAFEGSAGWPVLVPLVHLAPLRAGDPTAMPDALIDGLAAAGLPLEAIELGDPGATHDVSVPRDRLPPYVGPTQPAAGHVHEWGDAIADIPEDAPLEGPALAPYGQAVTGDPEQPG